MLVIGLIGIKIIVGVAYDVKFCKEPCGSKGMDFFEVQRDPLSRMPVAEEGITERSDVIPPSLNISPNIHTIMLISQQ